MKLSDFYIKGRNADLVPGILGLFWTRVFPQDNGLVQAVDETAGHTLDYGETYMRRMIDWLTGGTDDVDFVERLEVVPVESVYQDLVKIGDGQRIGDGVYIGAPGGSLRWILPLSNEYADIPVIIPVGGKPLLKNADYTVDGRKVVLRESPLEMGIAPSLEDIDGVPTAAYSLLLAGCVPLNGGGDNFSFYKLPDGARKAMLDIVTHEASLDRILQLVQRCAGCIPPSVFEKTDDEGPYTVITSVWQEEGRSYGLTTGGEIVKIPEGLLFAQGMAYDERLKVRPWENIARGIDVKEKASDSGIIGLRALDALAPNRTDTLAAGEAGVIGGARWEVYFDDILDDYGKTPEELLPAATENVLVRLYDRLGRKQPSVVYLDNPAASRVAEFSDALEILKDCLPAGSLLVTAVNDNIEDNVSISTEDSIETFPAVVLSDVVEATISDRNYIRGTLL